MPTAAEIIGAIGVVIGGDITPLLAAYASAEAATKQAGAAIASTLTSAFGAVGSAAKAGVGAAAAALGTIPAAAAGAAAAVSGLFATINTGSAHSVSEIQATSGALRVLEGTGGIRAAERFLTMIPGLATGLQLAFPAIGAIALADAMSKTIDKASGLEESIKALGEATKQTDEKFAHMVSTIDGLNAKAIGRDFGAAAGQLAEAKKQGAEARDILEQIGKKQLELKAFVADAFSLAKHPSLGVPFLGSQEEDAARNHVKELQKTIAGLEADYTKKVAESNDTLKASQKTAAEDAGTLAIKQIANELAASKGLAATKREIAEGIIAEQKSAADSAIEAIQGPYVRAMAVAQEEVQVARDKARSLGAIAGQEADEEIAAINRKAAAQKLGKTPLQGQEIDVETQGSIAAVQRTRDTTVNGLDKGVTDAQAKAAVLGVEQLRTVQVSLDEANLKGLDEIDAKWKKLQEEVRAYETRVAEAANRATEIGQASAGEQAALKIQGQKIALEAQYGAQLQHTDAQHIAYLQQIAALDQKGRQDVIDGKEEKLATELAVANELRDVARIASLRAEIAKLSGENVNASTKAQGDITAQSAKDNPSNQLNATLKLWGDTQQQKINAEKAVVEAFEKIPAALGSALANAVFEHGKGTSAGQQVGKAAEGVGKQLVGQVFTQGIEKLIAAIVIQTGLQAAWNAIFPVIQTPAIIATNLNTEAVADNTAAIISQIALLGFAGGTDSAPGGFAWVGEKGPEIMHVPRGAQIIPNHKIGAYADGVGLSKVSSSQGSGGGGDVHIYGGIHAHGITDSGKFMDHVARELPNRIKNRVPGRSAFSN